jgi:hypothetical protein
MGARDFRPRVWWAYLIVVVALLPGAFLSESRALAGAVAVLTLLLCLHDRTEPHAALPTLVLCLAFGIRHGYAGILAPTPFLGLLAAAVGSFFIPSHIRNRGRLLLQSEGLALNGFLIGVNPTVGVCTLMGLAALLLLIDAAERE